MRAPVPAIPHFRTPEAERRYWAAMADLAAELHHPELSRSYALASADCPAGCPCDGCERVREEVASVTAARKAKSKARANGRAA